MESTTEYVAVFSKTTTHTYLYYTDIICMKYSMNIKDSNADTNADTE